MNGASLKPLKPLNSPLQDIATILSPITSLMNTHTQRLANQTHASGAPRYTRTAIALHWLIALLIIGNVVLVLSADSLPDD